MLGGRRAGWSGSARRARQWLVRASRKRLSALAPRGASSSAGSKFDGCCHAGALPAAAAAANTPRPVHPEHSLRARHLHVAVGMSGGVDSTVSALLLKQAGHDVTGVFMKNWDEREETGVCTAERDLRRVEKACRHLDIPCRSVDFVQEYWIDVFSDFLHQYQRGFTPNPDFLCNHKIKFSAFLQFCLAEIPGVDRIATGHYAQLAPLPQTPHSPRTFGLRTAVDANKDQTYFMAGLSQDVLKHVMFPVGHLSKPDVVALAREAGLHEVADQRESMGICFIGKRRFGDFISEYLAPRPGRFVTRDGDDLGGHMGHFRFTRGQCAHIPSLREKHFVADKCAETNTVIVVPGRRHPALYTTQLAGDDWRWSCSDAALLAPLLGASSPRDLDSGFTLHCQLRTRHRMPLLDCTVALPPGYFSSQPPAGPLEVTSAQPVRAVTPGQIVALYKNGFCIAGGTITSIGPSLADLGLDLEAGVA